jgi:hypothetical protein
LPGTLTHLPAHSRPPAPVGTLDDAQAAETVDQLGRASRVRLRRAYGCQSAAFAAALGVGVILPAHVAVPELLREAL